MATPSLPERPLDQRRYFESVHLLAGRRAADRASPHHPMSMRMRDEPRHLVLALVLAGLAAPVQAQTGAPVPAVTSTSAAAAATNPVRVADLIDLPIVDENKSTLGRVRAVVRTADGKLQLLLPLGGLLGFGERVVPIPIERVAMTGPQITVVDLPPDRFQETPTWYGSDSKILGPAETVPISRR